jgi:TolA-binding protein
MNVVISPNIKKTSVRIDPDGNIINKDTKEVIEGNNDLVPEQVVSPVMATPQPQPFVQPTSSMGAKSIQEQIDETKKQLEQLEELKQLKIQTMKAEIELLESK